MMMSIVYKTSAELVYKKCTLQAGLYGSSDTE